MEILQFDTIAELEDALNKYCDKNTNLYTSIGVTRESKGLIHCVSGAYGFKLVSSRFDFSICKYEFKTWELR